MNSKVTLAEQLNEVEQLQENLCKDASQLWDIAESVLSLQATRHAVMLNGLIADVKQAMEALARAEQNARAFQRDNVNDLLRADDWCAYWKLQADADNE
jgi:hypothetical protein